MLASPHPGSGKSTLQRQPRPTAPQKQLWLLEEVQAELTQSAAPGGSQEIDTDVKERQEKLLELKVLMCWLSQRRARAPGGERVGRTRCKKGSKCRAGVCREEL